MALPVGQIDLGQVNTELGITPATTTIQMNQANVRTLAGVPTGAISMQNLQGKSNTFTFTLSSAANVNLRTAALAAGWPGSSNVVANIPSAVTISSSTTATAALIIDGAWPAGVRLNNAGLIVGRGGNGGNSPNGGGGAGGVAISIASAASINNTGTIAGGGGGGKAGTPSYKMGLAQIQGGGGGGGGAGVSSGGSGQAYGGGTPGGNGTIPTFGAGGFAGGNPGGSWGSAGGAGGAGGAATSGAPTYVTWIATGTRYGTIG